MNINQIFYSSYFYYLNVIYNIEILCNIKSFTCLYFVFIRNNWVVDEYNLLIITLDLIFIENLVKT